ncbi:MAG: ribonuclease H-like YkuK family protein [Flavobacteriaceae bacterium]
MLLFKNIQGHRIDPVSHTLEVIKAYPYAEIHIGTDSQNINKKTNYTVVIAYRLGSRGVHYILSKFSVDVIRDMWTRLWKEAECSVDLAEWLTKKISIRVEIDMDYNGDENFKSHKLISAAKGWANSLGYKVNVKPDNQIATRAADHHCK